MNIAIDGPAGAGKSTIAKQLAARFGFIYLDTGAMYRAVALKTLRLALTPDDAQGIERMLKDTHIDIKYAQGAQRIYLDGEDVSEQIRTPEVSKAASGVAALPCVRLKMVELQREIAQSGDVILDGRDIGTYVLPHAEVKFYLTASVDERAKRRYDELTAKGVPCTLSVIHDEIAARDYNDEHREFAPLRRADDAVLVDSTTLTVDEVLARMRDVIEEKRK